MANTKPDADLTSILEKALALSPEARASLVNELLESLAQDPGYYPDWHRKAVRDAIDELESDPESAIPLDEHLRRSRKVLEDFRAKQP